MSLRAEPAGVLAAGSARRSGEGVCPIFSYNNFKADLRVEPSTLLNLLARLLQFFWPHKGRSLEILWL